MITVKLTITYIDFISQGKKKESLKKNGLQQPQDIQDTNKLHF